MLPPTEGTVCAALLLGVSGRRGSHHTAQLLWAVTWCVGGAVALPPPPPIYVNALVLSGATRSILFGNAQQVAQCFALGVVRTPRNVSSYLADLVKGRLGRRLPPTLSGASSLAFTPRRGSWWDRLGPAPAYLLGMLAFRSTVTWNLLSIKLGPVWPRLVFSGSFPPSPLILFLYLERVLLVIGPPELNQGHRLIKGFRMPTMRGRHLRVSRVRAK